MRMGRAGRRIRIQGRVQGVGFRPYVWRLANEAGLTGQVLNDGYGVTIEVWGRTDQLDDFIAALRQDPPPLAEIESLRSDDLDDPPFTDDFSIAPSSAGTISTQITPDAATCPDCLREVFDPGNRRYRYPFTNCTHCGPRLSIVEGIPYDRARTSMRVFDMCADCQREYEAPLDRRFHAQPNACPACGPHVWLEDAEGRIDCADVIATAARLLTEGKIIAIKGIGGFHLACDATNAKVVEALRHRKQRIAKPFAVMVCDLKQIEAFCHLLRTEAALLSAPSAPIVLLERRDAEALPGVAPDLNRLGVMLPYSPLHHLLMAVVDGPLVMTSGNASGRPQVTGNAQARTELSAIADVWLMHDRAIVNRLDDSIMRVDMTAPIVLRRARGCAPAPIRLHGVFSGSPPILAMGAEQKATFCLLSDGQAVLSQHIGDLTSAETYADYRAKIALFRDLYDITPKIIAIDTHPDYLSTRFGRILADELGAKVVTVQHHHAHLASTLAEHRIAPDDALSVGLILDGTGLGTDGTIWGGEVLVGDYAGFERTAHFQPVALPGGAAAVRAPWRNLVAHLHAAFGAGWREEIRGTELDGLLGCQPVGPLVQMIEKGVNSPLASSAGRLFDAVAAALGIAFDVQHYEGQAAMELEALVTPEMTSGGYAVAISDHGVLSWAPFWAGLISDLKAGVARNVIATRFHIGLASGLVAITKRAMAAAGTNRVILSGGVMQNRFLRDTLQRQLRASGCAVLCNEKVPANDGGISLGQACAAAALLNN